MKYFLVAMLQVLWFLLTSALLLSQPVPTPATAIVSEMALSPMPAPPLGCPSTCGKVDIPYPFSIGKDCAWPDFDLICNNSFNPPRLYYGNIEVIDMTLETSHMRVFTAVSYIYKNSSNTTESRIAWWYNLTDSPFLISSERNVFTAIGCDTLAYLRGRNDFSYSTGCITTCESLEGAANDGDKCTGLGCCQAPILSNLSKIAVRWGNNVNDTVFNNAAWRYSPCSYAFVAEKDWYKFSGKDLNGDRAFYKRVGDRSIPLVLDWAIMGNGTCPPTAPACVSTHSYCVNATNGRGYLCNCSEGYSGNPYVTGGCKRNTDFCYMPNFLGCKVDKCRDYFRTRYLNSDWKEAYCSKKGGCCCPQSRR